MTTNSMFCIWLFINSIWLPILVQGLQLSVDPVVSLETPTIITWTRDNFDLPNLVFDLRFTKNKQDVGLAATGVEMQSGQFTGTVSVQFEDKGLYTVVAVVVNGEQPEQIAESRLVAVVSGFTATTSPASATSTSSSTTANTTSPSTTSASQPKRSSRPNIRALIGGILGSLVLVALVCALLLFLRQRRRAVRRCVTFHREMMLAPKEPDIDGSPTVHSKSLMDTSKATSLTSLEDLESNLSPTTPLMSEAGLHPPTTATSHTYHEPTMPKGPHATTGHGSSSSTPQTSTE
ncbi:hypothetical protein BJ165DRAFT_127641 [Panaeolus papilionaceus]|nr:hypothetical protein BJ165DRAFT_127641 [Panaeolus papilionaceus]